MRNNKMEIFGAPTYCNDCGCKIYPTNECICQLKKELKRMTVNLSVDKQENIARRNK